MENSVRNFLEGVLLDDSIEEITFSFKRKENRRTPVNYNYYVGGKKEDNVNE